MDAGAMGSGGDSSASSASVPGSFGGGGDSSSSGDSAASSAPANDNAAPRERAAANDNAEPEEPKWAREKTKIKRGGEEREYTLKEALAMLGDDYEHEVIVSKEPRKAKYADLVRGYQKSGGAEQLMRQAAEERRKLQEQIEFGKKDPEYVLRDVLGIEDPEQWAIDRVRARIAREKELDALHESDPGEYHRRMQAMAEEKLTRKTAFETTRKQREEQARAAQESNQKQRQHALGLLKAAGLPQSDSVLSHVGAVMRKYAELQYPGTIEEAVAEAKQSYLGEVFGMLDGLGDEQLLEVLGKDRRKRLRELELAKVNGKPAPRQQDGDEPPTRRTSAPKEISEREFMRGR